MPKPRPEGERADEIPLSERHGLDTPLAIESLDISGTALADDGVLFLTEALLASQGTNGPGPNGIALRGLAFERGAH